jgi:hypothetical protein
LSDDEYEWLARSYLYTENWKNLVETIDSMPPSLKKRNVWLYWEAKAYENLNKPEESTKYLKQISNDYSYYSMLTNSELGVGTIYKSHPPKITKLNNSNEAVAARIGLNLYQEGKNNNLKHLIMYY